MMRTMIKLLIVIGTIGLAQSATANGIGDGIALNCDPGTKHKLAGYTMADGWCYHVKLSCKDLDIGEFITFFDPFYGSWTVGFTFVGAEESGGCGSFGWQVLSETWSHKCKFDGGREGKVDVKAVDMKKCLDE